MIKIIGNSLNSVNKKVLDKMNKMDLRFIKKEVASQIDNGASYIEINASSLLDREVEFLRIVIPIIEEYGANACVMSNKVESLIEAIKIAKRDILVGPVEFDEQKYVPIAEMIKKEEDREVKIIAHINDLENGKIQPEKSLLVAQRYVDSLLDLGVRRKNILLYPEVKALDDDFYYAKDLLTTLELFKLDFPRVNTILNVFYISDGLPKRHIITSYFASLAISRGLDYIVANVNNIHIREAIITTQSILGKDKNFKSYLEFCKRSKTIRECEDNE